MTVKPQGPQIGRLALRVEGDNWNAYYAQTGTMDGAIFLGSIRMGLVATNIARKQQFMDLTLGLVAGYRAGQESMR